MWRAVLPLLQRNITAASAGSLSAGSPGFNRMFSRKMTCLFSGSNLHGQLNPVASGAAVAIALLAISALVNRLAAKKAERDNPPMGKFVEVKGVRLHYIEEGDGEPLVLLHGNAVAV